MPVSTKLDCLYFLLALLFTTSTLAVDGVLEINQACAENTGCFEGDSAGFPVTITERGIYRLTSSLLLTDVNLTAIEVTIDLVTIDLNGFEVAGPVTCTGGGASLKCAPDGSGIGIDGGGGSVWRTTIRNGSVVGFGGAGIVVGPNSKVEDLKIIWNNGAGIAAGERGNIIDTEVSANALFGIAAGSMSKIEGCNISDNLWSGISTGEEVLIFRNQIWNHGQFGITVGERSRISQNTISSSTLGDLQRAAGVQEPLGNSCDAGCSPDGRRLFYLTQGTDSGANALMACDAGFHMASLWEILDPSNLRYDTSRGFTTGDSGEGPTANTEGWVRTGHSAVGAGEAGQANCQAWESPKGGDQGTLARYTNQWETVPANDDKWPWKFRTLSCTSFTLAVWFVQD